MTSNLACIGLGVPDERALGPLLDLVVAESDVVGSADGLLTRQRTDASGSRLSVFLRGRVVEDLVPSFAGSPGAHLTEVSLVAPGVVMADVVDQDGETCTRLTCDLEQWRHLGADPVSGEAAITAFGLDVTEHSNAEVFAASPASLVRAVDDPAPDALRFGAESFISYGAFGSPEDSSGAARLAGTVLSSDTRRVEITGQSFHAVRVRTTGFEVDLCLAVADHPDPPAEGTIVSGNVYLVASMEQLWATAPHDPPRKRRWFSR
jgi:hypothetical protein